MVNDDLEMQKQAKDAVDPIPEEAAAILGEVETDDPTATAAEGEQQGAPQVPTKELVTPLVSLVCMAVVPAWEISQDEQSALADSYAAVIDKYFPGGISMGPEMGAALVTAAIIAPRLGRPMKAEDPEPEPMQERGQDAA